MHVGVSIVGFRNSADVAQCVDALQHSTHGDFEVVICENGGTDAHADLLAKLPSRLPGGQAVLILEAPRNLGYAGGVNACMAATPDADAWWVLNPDTQPAKSALAELVARLEAGGCEAVGSTVVLPTGQVQSFGGIWDPWLARAISIGHGFPLTIQDGAAIERRQNYLNGASMLVSRRFVDITGPMREDYFLYCEEVEWCLRALDHGIRLGFAPHAMVVHQTGTSMNNFAKLRGKGRLPVYLRERNRILLTKDHYPARWLIAVAVGVPLLLYRYGRSGSWRYCMYGINGFLAGVFGQRGAPPWLPA